MRIRHAAVAAAAAAIVAAGCGEKCPTESPQVQALANCTASPGQTVSYQIRLCPTCNETGITCDVQIQGSTIFLDPMAEACSGSSSCPPSCAPTNSTCSFTAPGAEGPYTVSAYDPASNTTRTGTLTVQSGAAYACNFP